MSILIEQKMAKKYLLKKNSGNNQLLDVTLENIAKAEAMINSDSRYNQKDVEKNIKRLQPHMQNRKLKASPILQSIFSDIVNSINISNRTRMSSTEEQAIVSYLLKQSNLIERLYKRDFCLICQLVTCSNRKNYSFATKFCHYMCYYLFAKKKQQDNFSIYDSVVAGILGKYAAQYNIYKCGNAPYEQKDFSNYKQYAIYSDVIDKIRAVVPNNISRNGFDHLLWYANK